MSSSTSFPSKLHNYCTLMANDYKSLSGTFSLILIKMIFSSKSIKMARAKNVHGFVSLTFKRVRILRLKILIITKYLNIFFDSDPKKILNYLRFECK